jgi:plasmid replication initiation protein|tara:strand:+ start:2858 stop:3127 length:270 start_codon:yes stop_codon:yes gene_type:complete
MNQARIKYVQGDLFDAIPDFSGIARKSDQETMQCPFFSLSKTRRVKPIDYKSPDGNIWVHVSAPADYGIATIYDQDILCFLAAVTRQKR